MERDSVGVRELRQNLSVYLGRVVRGESLVVTDRGRPVAQLGPLPERASPLDRLRAEGRVRPARGDLAELGMPPPVPARGSISEALAEERAEDD
jgi:prevent-host-death family protein